MKWFLNVLFLSVVKSVYSKQIEFSRHYDSKEINKMLGKILHAAKFNELADTIAERAVKKISEYQNSKFIDKLVTKDGMYRSKMKALRNEDVNYSVEKLRGPAKHKHGKIDVDAILKKTAPVNDYKLRYTYLKNKHGKAALRSNEPQPDISTSGDEDANSQGTNYNVNLNEAPKIDLNIPQDFHKIAQDIQLDFDKNIKTISNENLKQPLGGGANDAWKKTKYPHKSERKFRSEAAFLDFGENASREKDKTVSRTTRTEGDKQFAHVASPDYKEYHELMANAELS